jgi:probable rRNA maturation factor
LVTFEREIEGSSQRALALFLSKARRAARLGGKVDVVVTTNRQMRQLNRQFRGKDKPTDVLSFPAGDVPGSTLAGEIAISGDIAAANGRKLGHGTAVELKILVLHGVLHLAGHDHESDGGEMARKEQELRRELRLPEGLIERASVVVQTKSRSLAPLGMTHPKLRRHKSARSGQ